MKKGFLLPLLVIIIALCSYLFASFYQQAKQEALKSLHREQLLHAGNAARGLEDFFRYWTSILTSLSESAPVVEMDRTAQNNIEVLYNANRDSIRAITRVDAAGRIVYTFPLNPGVIGRDISRQNHIREIMQTHKPLISDVFYAVQGYHTIAIHVPVFHQKSYRGTLAVTLDFSALSKRYIEEIKIGKTGYAWMVSGKGIELYCPVPGHTGRSVFENNWDSPSILAMAGEMLTGGQGTTVYAEDKIRGDRRQFGRKHAVFMPVRLGNTFWSIVVCSAEDEIVASLKDFRNRLILVVSLLLLAGVLFSYYGLKASLIIREEKRRHLAEKALRESEEKYRLVVENAAEAIFITQAGRIQFPNRAAVKMLGYPEEVLTARSFTEFVDPADRGSVEERDLRRSNGEALPSVDTFRMVAQDKTVKWMETRTVEIRWNGEPAVLNLMSDITERRLHEEKELENYRVTQRLANEMTIIAEIGRIIGSSLEIDEVYERFAAEARKLIPFDRLAVNLNNRLENTICVAFVSGDEIPDRRIQDVCSLTGTLSEWIIQQRAPMIFQGESFTEIVRQLPALLPTVQAGFRSLLSVPLISRDEVIGVLHFRSKRPDVYTKQELRLAERISAQIAEAIANGMLFAEIKKMEREVREMSFRDQMTGLYNRRGFIALAEQQLRAANRARRPLLLTFFDCDGLKWINDTFGHKEGDRLLVDTADLLRSTFRASDIIARLGGDEFAVLSIDAADPGQDDISLRLQQHIEEYNGRESRAYRLSISWGTAVYSPESPLSLDQLISEADGRMYAQKEIKVARRE